MKKFTKVTYTILLTLTLIIPLSGCGCSRSKNRANQREVVSHTLKNFIKYQEEADKEKVVSLVVEAQRDTFKRTLEDASRDDMIQSSIEFMEYNYQLQETDDKIAVFWSESGKNYLIITLEDGKWLINPKATDEMNN